MEVENAPARDLPPGEDVVTALSDGEDFEEAVEPVDLSSGAEGKGAFAEEKGFSSSAVASGEDGRPDAEGDGFSYDGVPAASPADRERAGDVCVDGDILCDETLVHADGERSLPSRMVAVANGLVDGKVTEGQKHASPLIVEPVVANGVNEEEGKEIFEPEVATTVIEEEEEEILEPEVASSVLEEEEGEITDVESRSDGGLRDVTEDAMLEAIAGSTLTNDSNSGSEEAFAPSVGKEYESSSNTPTLSKQPSLPAGLGSSNPLPQPSAQTVQRPRVNGPSTSQNQSPQSVEAAGDGDDTEENDEIREKLQMIRVKFLRLAYRLGQTPHNVVVAQVLYRLGLAEQLRKGTGRSGVFSFDRANVMAEQLEASGQEPLDFSCTIMVIGKSGVGKSATINSIFDDVKLQTSAFHYSTTKVQEIVGKVEGIKVKVIDTPGLSCSSFDQRYNERILRSVKKLISKNPPDIVLYFDRMDMQIRDFNDVPLLRTISDTFGASIWFNAIIVLTHAASAPPDGQNGVPYSYEMYVTQRSHVVQQAIRQAAGDVRLMNPVALVENHTACRTNRAGQRVLPNGQVWKPQLLLLSFASKILAEANEILKLQDSPSGKTFSRTRAPPLPFLLSSLLQSRPQVKLPHEQYDEDHSIGDDLLEGSDSDGESEYDELPPFKSLTKSELSKLSTAQRRAYYDELAYREKLFALKQLKEERRRRKMMKKMAEETRNVPSEFAYENIEDESNGHASVPVPLPDLALPSSFDSDNPTHRYRFLDSSNPWLVRPVMDSQGWDHDIGYDCLNVERLFVVNEKIPISVNGNFTKDKKEFNLQMEVASSIKHSDGASSSLGMDLQSVGKDMAYTCRGDIRFKNFGRNNTALGVSGTLLGDSVSGGIKVEDKLSVSQQLKILFSGGVMTGRGDAAYGGRIEATLRDRVYPIGRMLSTLALSIVDWHGDLALGCNFQSQVPMGRGNLLTAHGNVSNKGTGQVGIRLSSTEHLQIALFALLPIFRNISRSLFNSTETL